MSAFIVDGVVEEEAEEVRSEEVWWALLIRLSTSRTSSFQSPCAALAGKVATTSKLPLFAVPVTGTVEYAEN